MTRPPLFTLYVKAKGGHPAAGKLNTRSRALPFPPCLDLILIRKTKRTEPALSVVAECSSLFAGDARREDHVCPLLGYSVVLQSSPSCLKLFASHPNPVVGDRERVSDRVRPHEFYSVSPSIVTVRYEFQNCDGRIVDDL